MKRAIRHGLLGTVVEVRVEAGGEPGTEDVAIDTVMAEIERLEATLTIHDPASAMCRWRSGALVEPPPEVTELAELALDWAVRTDGRFDPTVETLAERWREAVESGVVPERETMQALADAATPAFGIRNGLATMISPGTALSFNALAKGWIVDRSIDAAMALAPEWIVVSAGGDLAHRGAGATLVGVENPHRPYDNEPPIAEFQIANRAVATSGSSRRGVQIGGEWFSHVIDPRTGWPADGVASVTVVADDAATADVLATAAAVGSAEEAVELIEGTSAAEALVISADGDRTQTAGWTESVVVLTNPVLRPT